MAEGEANGRTWIKVDTDLLLATLVDDKLERSSIDRHRQVAAYLALIAWSRRRLTDGAIPKTQAAGVVAKACGLSRSDSEVTLSDLAMTGMVKTDRHRYLIPDYAEWQQTRADVIALSERQSANARKRRPRQSDDQPVANQRQASGQQNREEKKRSVPVGRGRAKAARAQNAPIITGIENDEENTLDPATLANHAIRTDPLGRLMAAIGSDADPNTERTITRLAEQAKLSQSEIEQAREAIEAAAGVSNRARYAVGTIKRLVAERG